MREELMSLAGDEWVLLHGTPLSPAVWDGVAARLSRRGPVRCPAVTLARDGGDATAELAQRLAASGLPKRMDLVGHSFGGQVALDLALLAPARVRTLTLVGSRDTPYPAFAAAAAALRRGDPLDPSAALGRWFTAAELSADGPVVQYARNRLERAGRRGTQRCRRRSPTARRPASGPRQRAARSAGAATVRLSEAGAH
jgi:pimeloyl-ACP methyl ester carboxylesterase